MCACSPLYLLCVYIYIHIHIHIHIHIIHTSSLLQKWYIEMYSCANSVSRFAFPKEKYTLSRLQPAITDIAAQVIGLRTWWNWPFLDIFWQHPLSQKLKKIPRCQHFFPKNGDTPKSSIGIIQSIQLFCGTASGSRQVREELGRFHGEVSTQLQVPGCGWMPQETSGELDLFIDYISFRGYVYEMIIDFFNDHLISIATEGSSRGHGGSDCY